MPKPAPPTRPPVVAPPPAAQPSAVVCEPGRHVGCLHERMRERKALGK